MLNFAYDFDQNEVRIWVDTVQAGITAGTKKTTTESQHRVDVRYLKKQGFLQPGVSGSLSWTCRGEQTGSIGFRMEKDRMVLNYRHRSNGGEWESLEYSIGLNRTPCNYGGFRVWLLCPRCNRRVVLLYGAGKYFLCRHCHGLTYASQQEPDYDRMMRKAQKIRRKLGGAESSMEPFPEKPQGMHWRTYNRFRVKALHLEQLGWRIVGQRYGVYL